LKLADLMTFFALLLTAYGATQEYTRVKMKLIPKLFFIIFWISSLILFLSSFNEVKVYFMQFDLLHSIKTQYPTLWLDKYFFLIAIIITTIFISLKYFTRLRYGNQKLFLELIENLSKQENYELLNHLINDNIETMDFKVTKEEVTGPVGVLLPPFKRGGGVLTS